MENLGKKLKHIIIPLVTPFKRETQEVNYEVMEKLVDHLIEKRLGDTLMVTGTTGEFNTFSYDERVELFKVVKGAA
ncbi:unnamed protein product, partial [marine sediment metagenome]